MCTGGGYMHCRIVPTAGKDILYSFMANIYFFLTRILLLQRGNLYESENALFLLVQNVRKPGLLIIIRIIQTISGNYAGFAFICNSAITFFTYIWVFSS